jgi:hypothetical protein
MMRQHDYFQAPLQTLFNFMRSPDLATRARELGGFDLTGAGEVRFAP